MARLRALLRQTYRDVRVHLRAQGLLSAAVVALLTAGFAWVLFGVSAAQVAISALSAIALYTIVAAGFSLIWRAPRNLARHDVARLDTDISVGDFYPKLYGRDIIGVNDQQATGLSDTTHLCWVAGCRETLSHNRGVLLERFDSVPTIDRASQVTAQTEILRELRGALVTKWGPTIEPG